ncbi:MAG: nitrous oxide reductase family maturation protein NosD [Phycisphaeraceae bacterium]|nr:nitrous oxide reductase family maturation protein NosD [Phycisphaeraceae bacterium]
MSPPRLTILISILATVVRSADGGTGNTPIPVSVVAEMIDNAEQGDAILVPAGIYEGNLIIRKPIVLDGSAGAIFDGLGEGTVIEVLAEQVTIRGCVIRATDEDVTGEPAAIRVIAADATIESNTIDDALFGIDLREAPNAVIRNNTIACKNLEPGRRGDGIRLWWSHGCTVEGNTVRGSRDMVFWYSEDLRIDRNTVTDSRYGLHFMYSHDTVIEENDLRSNSVGIYLMYSNRITLRGNRLTNNRGASGYGVGLKDCDDIIIAGNELLANRVGVYLDNSPSSVDSTGLFESNMVAFNEVGLLATPNTHGNVFTGNAFVENEEPAATHGRGRLVSNDFARDGVGNYWSDYAGFDLDGDGIGDVAYEPRSLFGAMLANEPNLRLFVHSPAQQAIEFTARALPELRPESTLIDPSPLASPPRINSAIAGGGIGGARMAVLAATLLSIAVACIAALGFERGLPAPQTGVRS